MTDPATARKPISSYADIEGWFFWDDRVLFDALLAAQQRPGTLVELGAYLGRSAVIMGDHLRAGERFILVDLFGAEVDDLANRSENTKSYATLTRSRFEANYLAMHDRLPEVVQGSSTDVVDHVAPGTARFVHVDASHLYAQVAQDIRAIRGLVAPDAVVVFDDYRAEHTPGVAAAVWEAVAHGFVPFVLTRYKLYGTWGDATNHLEVVRNLIASNPGLTSGEQQIYDHPVLTVRAAPPPRTPPAAAPKTEPARETKQQPQAAASRPEQGRRWISDYLPPIMIRWVRTRRAARRSAR